MIKGYEDTRIQEYKDARIKGYNNKRIQEYNDTRIHHIGFLIMIFLYISRHKHKNRSDVHGVSNIWGLEPYILQCISTSVFLYIYY